jgi:hypothetical protein
VEETGVPGENHRQQGMIVAVLKTNLILLYFDGGRVHLTTLINTPVSKFSF